jgi:DNA polymerase-3 subunit alpha
MKMMSRAANEMFYYRRAPRSTCSRSTHEGIICQSACVQGIIPQNILDGNFEEAERWAQHLSGHLWR